MLKNLTRFAAGLALAAMLVPSLASAHDGDTHSSFSGWFDWGRHSGSVSTSSTNEFGVHMFGDKNANTNSSAKVEKEDNDQNDNNQNDDRDNHNDRDHRLFKDWRQGFIPNLFYNGTVTTTSSSGFTITTKGGHTFTINDGDAKIITLPYAVITNADINVGDNVHVTGMKTANGSTTVNASVVYVLPQNLKPAFAKGTVTAVNGNTITVQTKDDTSITVNTDANTQINDTTDNDNSDVDTQADIQVGMKAKLLGFWDSILNVFDAVRIKLF